jgi:hypothetical protein
MKQFGIKQARIEIHFTWFLAVVSQTDSDNVFADLDK